MNVWVALDQRTTAKNYTYIFFTSSSDKLSKKRKKLKNKRTINTHKNPPPWLNLGGGFFIQGLLRLLNFAGFVN